MGGGGGGKRESGLIPVFNISYQAGAYIILANTVFLQDHIFWRSLMTPCLKIWESLANLEGQNFFCVIITFICLRMHQY